MADLETRLSHLEEQMKLIEDLLKEMNVWKVQGQLDQAMFLMDSLNTNVQDLKARVKANDMDRIIFKYTEQEIKDLYTQSGLTANQVAEYLKKLLVKEDISESTVSRYINCQLGDLEIRNNLGRYFTYECLRKTKAVSC
jgi:capsule polysaccharide export protein KpsE/RkpR